MNSPDCVKPRQAAMALGLACISLLSVGVKAQPDLTGVWQLASPPMTSASGYPDLELTEVAEEKVNAYRALVDPVGDNPTLWCVTHGMPEIMMGGGNYPLEVIQKLDQVTIINEWLSETRRIFLGDKIYTDGPLFETRQGYSSGYWEDDVLVVETRYLQEMVDTRFPHSAEATITERFSVVENDQGRRLIIDTVMRDPSWLESPLEYRLEWTPSAYGWVQPYECMEERWLDRLDELAE